MRPYAAQIVSLGPVASPPGNPLEINPDTFVDAWTKTPQDQEFQIKAAGGVIGIEG